jgi:hypothetical protein
MDKTLARRCLAHLITNFQRCRHQPQCPCERVAGYCVLHVVAHDGGPLYGHRQHMVIHPSYYDVCDVSCDVIYSVIAVRARRMVRIFFLPYFGIRSKSDPCSYEPFRLESHILSFPKVMHIPPESPCIPLLTFTLLHIFVDSNSCTSVMPNDLFSHDRYYYLSKCLSFLLNHPVFYTVHRRHV